MPDDTQSREYAPLLEWDNICYSARSKQSFTPSSYVRLGLVQWQIGPYENLEALFLQAEYFVDSVSSYKSDFAFFAELFNAPLMAGFNNWGRLRQCVNWPNSLQALKTT